MERGITMRDAVFNIGDVIEVKKELISPTNYIDCTKKYESNVRINKIVSVGGKIKYYWVNTKTGLEQSFINPIFYRKVVRSWRAKYGI